MRRKERIFKRIPFFFIIKMILFLVISAPFLLLVSRFFVISLSRMDVFYELEFQEGDMALACHRFLKGLPLYPDPEDGFVHLTYPPATDVITSIAMVFMGSREIWVGRLVQFLFTMGTCIVLFSWVKRETENIFGALLAPLMFLAYYPITGYWYDIFRPDSGFIFLSLLGCYLLTWRYPGREGIMAGIAGALVFSIAAYTKQSAVLFGGVAFIFHALLYRNKTPLITATVGLFVSVLLLVYLYLTNPFFHVQCIQILLEHFKNLGNWRNRLNTELIQFTIIPFTAIFIWYLSSVFEKRWRAFIHLALLAVAIYAGLKGLFKIGGYKNNYYPPVVFLSLGMGWATGSFFRFKRKKTRWEILYIAFLWFMAGVGLWYLFTISKNYLSTIILVIFIVLGIAWSLRCLVSGERIILYLASVLIWALFLFLWGGFLCDQFGALTPQITPKGRLRFVTRYKVEHKIPDPKIVEKSRLVLQKIDKLPGTVYIPHHNYYTWLIGRPIFYPIDTIRDLTLGRGLKMIPRRILKALREKKFDFIILNAPIKYDWLDNPVRRLIQANYEQVESLEKMGFRLLRPVDATGMKPRYIWRRKDWKEKKEPQSRTR